MKLPLRPARVATPPTRVAAPSERPARAALQLAPTAYNLGELPTALCQVIESFKREDMRFWPPEDTFWPQNAFRGHNIKQNRCLQIFEDGLGATADETSMREVTALLGCWRKADSYAMVTLRVHRRTYATWCPIQIGIVLNRENAARYSLDHFYSTNGLLGGLCAGFVDDLASINNTPAIGEGESGTVIVKLDGELVTYIVNGGVCRTTKLLTRISDEICFAVQVNPGDIISILSCA